MRSRTARSSRVGWGAGHGWSDGYQLWIQREGFFSRSLHLMAYSSPLRVGDRVRAGDFIGREGRTGAYEEHLHLEITPGQWHARNDGQVDPKAWLFAHVGGEAPAGTDQGTTPDDSEEEWLMAAADDIRFIKEQLGGSSSRKTTLRQDVDWLKERVGGPITRERTLSQDVDAIKSKLKA